MSEALRVLSLGAGVQSSALALMMTAGEVEPPEFAVFADTQSEPAAVYRWLDYLKARVSFPIHVVTTGSLGEEGLRVLQNRRGQNFARQGVPVYLGVDGKLTGLCVRRCTRDYKIAPIKRFVRAQMKALGRKRVVQVMGISLDEVQRMRDSDVRYIANDYPLVDKRISRRGCLEWLRKNGHGEPPKSACVFCPYRNDAEWARMKHEDPAAFSYAVAWEKRLQSLQSELTEPLRSTPYLHPSCVALDQVDFAARVRAKAKNGKQVNLFNNACEGLCGV